MSVWGTDEEAAIAAAAAQPYVPPPKPKTSAWADVGSTLSAVPRGIGEAAAQVMGTGADLAGAYRAIRDATPAQRKAIDRGGVPAESFSSDLGDSLRDRGRSFRPDPQTASTAEQIVYGFSRGASKIIAGAVAGGVPGVIGAGIEEAFSTADDLRREGVDFGTRAKAGLVQGAGLALAALPAAGQTLQGTLALYALGGPGGFMAQQALTRDILRSAGYDKIGMGFDPIDPVGLAVASLIPAGFAAYGFRQAKIAQAVRSLPDLPRAGDAPPVDVPPAAAEAVPPSDLSPVARAAMRYPAEVEDAARVLYQAEVRDAANPGAGLRAADQHAEALARAEDQMASGEPVRVADVAPQLMPYGPRADGLNPGDQMIEAQLAHRIASDFDGAAAAYAALDDADGGKVLNTDTARELSPHYLADRTKSAAVHEPASQFIKDLYARKLAEPPGPGELPLVMFTAGGTGAGKTTAVKNIPAMAALKDQAQIVYDTNMNGYASSKSKVEQALAANKAVRIVLVARDPADALVNGALPRAERQRQEHGSGRTVPIEEHIKTHIGAVDTVRRLAAEYQNDPRVQVQVIDNSLGRNKATQRDLQWLGDLRYNDVEQRVRAALEGEREAGRISDETYQGFAGRAFDPDRPAGGVHPGGVGEDTGVRPTDRSGDGRGAERGGAGARDQLPGGDTRGIAGPTGSATQAVTERGMVVPMRWRVADVGDLVTSHTDDLTVDPRFPAELQPRDRSRAASADQIARIENDIRPELLGESPKAGDGAPIIGADGVVESGNARTIALRRAYESGKADGYRAWLEANAERFGLTSDQVRGINRPVLVREHTASAMDRAEFARQANESAIAAMSPTEQARADAARITDLSGLVTNDDGTINAAQSAGFIRRFMQQAVSPTERGAMTQASGQLSQAGAQRIRNAIFAKAYSDSDLVAMLTESTDANVRNVLTGMLRAAPRVAELRDLVAAGARQDADIAGPLVQSVRLFSQLRSEGRTVSQYLAQGDLLGGGIRPEVESLLHTLQADSRAPKRIAAMIEGMVDDVNAAGDPRQSGMFGDAPDGKALVAESAERAAMQARIEQAITTFPDLQVQLDGMGAPMRVDDFLAAVKAEADELAADAPLMQAAAECALTFGV